MNWLLGTEVYQLLIRQRRGGRWRLCIRGGQRRAVARRGLVGRRLDWWVTWGSERWAKRRWWCARGGGRCVKGGGWRARGRGRCARGGGRRARGGRRCARGGERRVRGGGIIRDGGRRGRKFAQLLHPVEMLQSFPDRQAYSFQLWNDINIIQDELICLTNRKVINLF